jgi:1,4-dihydroxy-2-naphthoate octaprenyltransferase
MLLQVLSNLANDYGDFKNGADNQNRIGPSRAVQSGLISPSAMRKAVIYLSIAAFFSGIGLLVSARNIITQQHFFMLIGLGIVAIAAALFYTAGKRPYGYAGLGDISVFLFFGLLGVIGNFFLQVGFLRLNIFLPAFAFGAFSVMVLNLNNMRDIQNDANAGKKTIPVRIGAVKAKIYHMGLFVVATVALIIYSIESYRFSYVWVWPLISLIFVPDLIKIARISEPALFDPFLKKTAIKTFLLSLVIFAHCIILNG